VIRRYLTIVGIVLVVTLGLAIWLKPPLSQVRENVETAIADYAREHGGAAPPVDIESHDWIVATSHAARIGEHTFFCFGAMKVTYCQLPD